MENVSELLLRNEHRFNQQEILLINPPRDSVFRLLVQGGRRVRVFTQDFGDYQWFLANGASVEFGLIPERVPEMGDVVLIQPRERARLNMMLHALASVSKENSLWLAGENRTGIKSAGKNLGAYYSTVSKVDNARHCVLYEASGAVEAEPFVLDDYEHSWLLPSPWNGIENISLPGTFAHGKLDKGSQLLLEAMKEQTPDGRVLDFACGTGVIGLALLAQNPEIELTLLDTSALALESTNRSLRANQREAEILPSDGLGEVEGSFDWIISNPPFHRGVANDLDIAKLFFSQAGHHLTRTGRMLLVYNHHLPYQGWLREYFSQVEVVKANRGFKVVQVGDPHK